MIHALWYPIEDYLSAGGLVMLPLAVVSLLLWALIVHKLVTLKALYRPTKSEDHMVRVLDNAGHAVLSGVQGQLIREFFRRRSGDAQLDSHIVDEASMAVSHPLERGLTLIGVLAAIAPLLGLLGTVVGMIATFNSIAVFGTGNARAMAGGISEALITTQTGLLIAIPGLYMRNFLQRRAGNLTHQVESLALTLKRQLAHGGEL
ncbi:MotA/TolQ/ExbB proton channel family protein [uncultured Desulfuromonas sp.]|uniref:MotA/TolQ/ExbB proton channel family protein n=1 Tax=uncultured Desulfuromonas sp. TaxID=181013 RepID=UPI002AAB4138|nr:MotA/TolQ/ExbB proton channel family protein [uncultured Desulfuromonas sp.]